MKKTIAILIATLMLLSMIPVNALAVQEDHVHTKDCKCECKVNGEHTKANCAAYTEVPGGKVEPVDCKFGYTLYTCDACGVVFADDFVQNENGHVWETEKAATAATCTDPAYKEKQVCKVCKTVNPELDGTAVKDSKPVGGAHKWELQTDIEDCLVVKAEFKCSKCGLTETREYDSHDYNDYPTSYVAPTCTANGTATFACKRCDHVKEVTFKSEDHKKQPIPADPFVDCTKPGSTAGEYCTVCGEVFTAPVVNTPKDCKWELIDTKTPATCDKDGLGVYECTVCGATKEAAIPAQHEYADKPAHKTEATCTEWGFDFYYCTVCGYLKPFEDADKHAPTGHVSFEDSKDVYKTEVEDTCLTKGSQDWTCDTCGVAQHIDIDVIKGHNVKTTVVPAYCHQFGYTVDYCTNENCDVDAVVIDPVSGMDLTVVNKDGLSLIDYVDAKDAKNNHNAVYNIGKTKDANNHAVVTHVVNKPTCTEAGAKYDFCPYCSYRTDIVEMPKVEHAWPKDANRTEYSTTCGKNDIAVYVCPDCGAEKKVEIPDSAPFKAHDFSIEHKAVAPTCLATGNKAYKECKNCGKADSDFVIAKVGHSFVKKVTVAQCNGTEGKTWYECEWCPTVNDKIDVVTSKYVYEATKAYATWAEAQLVHAELGNVGEIIRLGDCEKTGLIAYTCASCAKDVLVIVANDGVKDGQVYGQHKLEKVADAEAPTCQKTGKTAKYDCVYCDYTEGATEVAKVGHDMKASPCGDGTYCAFNCGEETGDGYEDHVIVTETKYAKATCTTIAFIHVYCKNCDTENKDIEYLTGYAPALGHDFTVKFVEVDSTCTTLGKTAGVKCSRCDVWETAQTVIPMKDHVNKDGVKLYDKCTDTTKDRVCVTCTQTIGQNHTKTEGKTVAATCYTEGYTLVGCVDCGVKELTNYVEKLDHTWSAWKVEKEATILEEGWETRYCTVCAAAGITTTEGKAIPVTAEIGIILDATNANGQGDVYTDSSLVAVTVTLDSAKLNAWGVAFDLFYSENLQFVKAEFSANNKFVANATAVDNNVDPAKGTNPPDCVSISAFAPNGEDKKLANVELEGKMEFVTLYFKVVNGEIAKNTTAVATFEVANSEVLDIAGVSKNVDPGKATIEIDKFMDYNADGDVTLQDVLAASKILSGELTVKNDKNEDVLVTYDVALDVDKDGEITADDLLNILAYINGAKTYADVTKA